MTEKSRVNQGIEFIRESRKIGWLFIFIAILLSLNLLDIQIPYSDIFTGTTRNFIIGIIVGSVALYLPASKFTDYFYTPQVEYVLEHTKNKTNVHKLKKGSVEDYEIKGGKPNTFENINGVTCYEVKNIDKEDKTIETTSKAQIDYKDQLNFESDLQEAKVRGRLLSQIGYKYLAFRKQLWEMAKASYWLSMSEQINDQSTMDEESLRNREKQFIPEIDEIREQTDLDIDLEESEKVEGSVDQSDLMDQLGIKDLSKNHDLNDTDLSNEQ